MDWQFTVQVIPIIVSGGIAGWLAILARRRNTPGAGTFAMSMLGAAIYAFAQVLELSSTDLKAKLFWAALIYGGFALMPTAWLFFALEHTQQSAKLLRRGWPLLWGVPVLVFAVAVSNPLHRLLWSQVGLVDFEGHPTLWVRHGVIFWLVILYGFTLLLAGSILILHVRFNAPGRSFAFHFILLIGLGLLWTVDILHFLDLNPWPLIDPTPYVLTLSGAIVGWRFLGLGWPDLASVFVVREHRTSRRSLVFERMRDGVVVLDSHNRIVDFNPAAMTLLDLSPSMTIGRQADEVLGAFQFWLKCRQNVSTTTEFTWCGANQDRWLDLHMMPLSNRRGSSVGRLLVFRDVTDARHTEEQLRIREHFLTVLNDITRAAVSAADFNAMLQILADRMGQLIDADGCYITLWDELTRTTIPTAAYGKHRDRYISHVFPPGDVTLTSTVLDTGRPLVIEDTSNSPLISPQLVDRFPRRSLLALPMIAGVQKLGAAIIAFEQTHHFTPDEIERGEQASAEIALVIAQARYLDAEQHSAHQLGLLYDVSRQIAATLEEKEIFQRTVDMLVKHFGFAEAAICMINDQDEIEAIVVAGTQDLGIRPGFKQKIGQGVAGQAAEKRAAYLTNDISQDRYYLNPVRVTTGSAMALPLLWEDKLLGVIYVESSHPNAFTSNDIRAFETLAAHVVTAVENARLYANARKRLRDMMALQSVSRVIASSLVIDGIFKTIVDLIHDLYSYSHVSIYQLDGDVLRLKAQAGYLDALVIEEIPIDTGVSGRAVRTRQVQFVGEASSDNDFLRADPSVQNELCVPLLKDETVFGTLNIETGSDHPLAGSDIDLLNVLAAQVTVAIENASLYQMAQSRVREAEMLRKATAALTSALDLQEVLGSILIHLEEVIPYDSASVQLLGEGYLEIVGGRGWQDPVMVVGLRFAVPGDNPNSVVIQQRRPYILSEATLAYPEFRKDPHSHIHSWLGVPLLIQERVTGMLALDSKQPGYFTAEHARLVSTFADQVAIALENARLYQSAKRTAERWAILYRVTQEVVAASLNPEEIYATIHRAVEQLMPSEAFAIGLLDELHQDIDGVYAFDKGGRYPSMRVPIEGSLSGHIITTGKSVYIPDFNGSAEVSSIHFGQEEEVHSILAVPLVLRNRAFGMLSAQSYTANAYNADDLALLEMLAAHVSAAIENARLFKELQRLAITDPMTGVYNLRGLYDLGHREVDRARRFQHPLTVLFLDIDHFKQVNDIYRDHTIGDQVLGQLAVRCRSLIREVDVFGRYGGEEFVIVLPETDIQEGQGVAERLRFAVANNPMPTDRGPVFITISLGVVGARENMPDFEKLVDQADTAMYTAKQAGRNRVVIFGS